MMDRTDMNRLSVVAHFTAKKAVKINNDLDG
ncbi:hypothetical protein BOTU111921_15395 [Bordetella tumbae]